MGGHIDGEITPLENIIGPQENVIVEVYAFGDEVIERDKINILSLKISDNTNSILAKIIKKNKKEFAFIKSGLKDAVKKKNGIGYMEM